MLREAGIPCQELSVQEMAARWPQINLEAVHWGIYEPEGGYLTARVACLTVLDGFMAEGGEYRQLAVAMRDLDGGQGQWDGLSLSDGTKLQADQYVFACGPWLGKLFPETIGNRIRPTRARSIFLRHACRRSTVQATLNCRSGLTIATNSCMAFQEIKAEDSRSPMIRAVRNSTRHQANELLARKESRSGT